MSNAIDPIGPRTAGTVPVTHDDPVEGPPPPQTGRTRSAGPRSEVPEVPEYPDTNQAAIANMVRAAKEKGSEAATGIAGDSQAKKVRAKDDKYTTPTTAIQRGLDSFKQSTEPTFRTSEGDVTVAVPFRMAIGPEALKLMKPDDPFRVQAETAQRNATILKAVGHKVDLTDGDVERVQAGRGAPEQIKRLTQQLIDDGHLAPGKPDELATRIRSMMTRFGVGIDCAGYVQQAFAASRGSTLTQAGFKPIGIENLADLPHQGFKKVTDREVQAGDMLILKSPGDGQPGHTIVVRDSRYATPEEAAALAAKAPPAWGLRDASKLRRFEFDSSWGSNADPRQGGVQRQVFWHDESKKDGPWLNQSTGDWRVEPSDAPYLGHKIEAFYRPNHEK
jgi:cell wall-associated NlpC family hydrolase